jgi:hypothetical protein
MPSPHGKEGAMSDEWETFCDVGYYHMWRLRRKTERGWNDGFHINTKAEAEGLCELLNKLERERDEAAFRKAKWPHDDNPFMSTDHDNDSSVYDEAVASVYEERNNAITHACRVSSVCRELKAKLEQYRRHTDTIITLLEIVEETDEGRQFSPNYIRSCRSFDLQKIGEAITHIKMLNDET